MRPAHRHAFVGLLATGLLACLQPLFAAEPLDPKSLDLEKLAKTDHVRTSEQIDAAKNVNHRKVTFVMTPGEFAKEFKCTPSSAEKDYFSFPPIRTGLDVYFEKRTNKLALLKYVALSFLKDTDPREVMAEFITTYGPPTEQVSRESTRLKTRSTDYTWKFPAETRRTIVVTVSYQHNSFHPRIDVILCDPQLAPEAMIKNQLYNYNR